MAGIQVGPVPKQPVPTIEYPKVSYANAPTSAWADPQAPPRNPGYDYGAQGYELPGAATSRNVEGRGVNGERTISSQQYNPSTGMYNVTGTQSGMTPLAMMERLSALFPGSAGYVPGGVLPPRIAQIAPPDPANRAAAEAAQFGRAKDAAGRTGRAAADNLADEMSSRGIAGGGAEVAATGNILRTAQGQIGEANREQAINSLARSEHDEDRNYQGALGQREGDIGQRGQDIGFQTQQQQLQLEAQRQRQATILSLFGNVGQLY